MPDNANENYNCNKHILRSSKSANVKLLKDTTAADLYQLPIQLICHATV